MATWREDHWTIRTNDNHFISDNLIIATGNSRKLRQSIWPGIENYQGSIIHSSGYKNGKANKGKKALVVGFGNSACEIALCLHEHDAIPSMSVRGAVNVVPREYS